MLRSALAAALLLGAAGLAGCSGGSAPTGPAPSGTATVSAAPEPTTGPAPAGSGAPSASTGPTPSAGASSLATLPVARCLSGSWTLVRFVATQQQTYGTGQGGDVTVRFTDGRYVLAGAGREPVQLALGGQTADLRVDGRSNGTYRVEGSRATFRDGSATGSATVEAGGQRQRLTMDQVANVIGLKGEGAVACTAQAMTVTLSDVRLELGRG